MGAGLGAVNGQAAAGAIGATSGELFAELLVKQFYGGDKTKLTQQQKLQIANLSAMLAGALAGSASDSTQGAVAGAQTGKNATENNFLAVPLPTVPPVAGNASYPNSEANQQLALALQQALKSLGQAPSQLCADNIDLCLKSTPLLAGLAAEYGITTVKNYLKSWFSGSVTEQERTIALDPKDTPKLEGKPIPEENKGLTTTTPIPEQNKKDGVLGTPIPEESQDLAALPGTEVGVGDWRDNILTADNRLPIPEPVRASNGLTLKSNTKHTPSADGFRPNAGIEPRNSLELFEKSVSLSGNDKVRYTRDAQGNIHRFFNGNDGTYHWSGSTGDKRNALKLENEVKAGLRKEQGWKIK